MSLGKKLLTHGSIYAGAMIANSGIALVLIPLYARVLSKEEYGVISLLATVAPFISLLISQGMQAAWFRLRHNQDTPEKLSVFETTVTWYLFASVLAGVGLIYLMGNPLAAVVTPGSPFYPLLFMTAVSSGANSLALLYFRKLQADQRSMAFGVFSIIRTALILGAIVFLVAGLEWGVFGKVFAEMIIAIVLGGWSLLMIRPGPPSSISGRTLKECLGYGLPLVPHSLMGQINNLIGRLMIANYIGLGAAGLYSMGHQLANLGVILATAMNQAYSPIFIKEVKRSEEARKEGDEAGAHRILQRVSDSGLLLIAAVSCTAMMLTAFAREVLAIVATSTYEESWKITAPVALAAVAHASYYVFSQSLLMSSRGSRLMPLVTGGAVMANFAGNVFLLPRLGFVGSSWAMLAANTTMALLAFFLGGRALRIPRRTARWVIVYVVGILAIIGFREIDLVSAGNWVGTVAKAACLIAAIALTAKGSGMRLSELRALLGRRSGSRSGQ